MKALGTRHRDGGRPSISVWCSHMSAVPAKRNQVRTRCQRMTTPGSLRRKNAKNPLLGDVCLLTTGVLISVRPYNHHAHRMEQNVRVCCIKLGTVFPIPI